jgi:hypothetical protein
MSTALPSITKRANKVLERIQGKAQMGVSHWEINFLKHVANLAWGSEKQLATLATIEKKVFGFSEYEQIKAAHKGEVFEIEN